MPSGSGRAFRQIAACQILLSVEAALFAYSLGISGNLAETELAKEDHKPILLIDGEKEGEG